MEQRHYIQEETPVVAELRDGPLPHQDQEAIDAAEAALEADEETSTATLALTTLLQQEARSRRNETWVTMAWSGGLLASVFWLLRYIDRTESSLGMGMMLYFALMTFAAGGLCFQFGRRSHRRKRSLQSALSQINKKSQVGPLIRTLQVPTTPVRNLAKQTLTGLLPTLRADDASLLTTEDRKILLKHLAILPNDPGYRDIRELFSRSAFLRELDFRLAILKALEQVGGEQELVVVERLIRHLPSPQNPIKVPWQMREAMQECLPYLQSRASDQRASAQLLRASGFPAASGADLLRPAATGATTPPEQLLRPSESQS